MDDDGMLAKAFAGIRIRPEVTAGEMGDGFSPESAESRHVRGQNSPPLGSCGIDRKMRRSKQH